MLGATAIADLVLPRVCVTCGRNLNLTERHICTVCLSDFPFTRFENIRSNPMANRFNELIQRDIEESARGFERYSLATALFFYSGNYREITKSLKYRRNFSAGQYFSRLLGERLSSSPLFSDVDTVIPVPLHWTRRLRRGYNQAGIIAGSIAEQLKGAILKRDILVRRRRTRSQALLRESEKTANVANAFKVRATRGFTPRHILLVDDVFTTGATIAACHRALREAFGSDIRISAATLAFVGE